MELPDATVIVQMLFAALLAIIGYMVKQVLARLERLEGQQTKNSMRLVRIETKLGIADVGNADDLA